MSAPSPPPLRVVGARQNNLADLSLEIPHDRLVVVTGVSGSGKSSLAFDTIFSEGQWRFLESLPAYARMLLEKTARPDVDILENVRPSIALEQRNGVRSARSTVGTLTEVYDLFRVLYATAGQVLCPRCDTPGRTWTPAAAAKYLIHRGAGGQATFEVPLGFVGTRPPAGWAADLLQRGFARVRLEGAVRRLDDPDLPGSPTPGTTVVLDRVRLTPEHLSRVTEAVEGAYRLSGGQATVVCDGAPAERFGRRLRCHRCDVDLPELRPVLFSFNHALGACPTCTGFGAMLEWDEEKVIPDPTRSLGDGAVEPWKTPANRGWQEQLEGWARARGVDLVTPWARLPEHVRDRVWNGDEDLDGVTGFFAYLETKRYKMHVRVFLARYRRQRRCPDCGGGRLCPDALRVTVADTTIAQVVALDVGSLDRWVRDLPAPVRTLAGEVVWRIEERLSLLLRLGLHYLTLDRPSRTLSGGEAQRTALALQLQNHLVGATYVLDEPTVGLHPRDVDTLTGVLADLARRGNSVVVVEHDLGLVARADHVIELGPGGGRDGGRILYQGPPGTLANRDTPTGRHLALTGTPRPSRTPRVATGHFDLTGCHLHNLDGLSIRFPAGVLTCVTGVSGSGKTSLVVGCLVPAAATRGLRGPAERFETVGIAPPTAVRIVDQSPMGRTPRSIPLTYIGAYDGVRKAFARTAAARRLGLTPRDFSFNVTGGRCERCKGTGFEKIEMYLFEDLFVLCEGCGGRRFRPEVLAVRVGGHSIHQVLGLTAAEAADLFRDDKKIEAALALLLQVGLGYLVLGQPAPTLSGGEAQRLKIVAELLGAKPGGVLYVLDEPTTGLHPDDVEHLVAVLDRLVDAGNTVVCVEHNLDFITRADWVIDLGPEGGQDGGRLVDAGPAADVAARSLGPTGRHLARWYRGEPS